MDFGLLGSLLFAGSGSIVDALLMPRLPGGWLRSEIWCNISGDIGIGARVKQYGVIDIPRRLLPRIKNNFFKRIVRMQSSNDPFDRIVKQDRTDTYDLRKFEMMRVVKERLELTNWFALVIKNCPATANPARIDDGAAFNQRSRLRLNFLLNLTTETIGITKADLQFGLFVLRQIADVRFAHNCRCKWRFTCGLKTVDVINNA